MLSEAHIYVEEKLREFDAARPSLTPPPAPERERRTPLRAAAAFTGARIRRLGAALESWARPGCAAGEAPPRHV
jgi:hypothetical protein